MINLLPPEVKNGYRYGRLNIVMLRWVLIGVIALVGLGAIATYGIVTLKNTNNDLNNQIVSQQDKINKENYTQVQNQVKDYSNSFKLVIKVLGQEVLFSKMLKQISTIIPTNTSLTNFQINSAQNAIEISAVADNYTDATQIQVNLADPANKIFSKADIINISCNTSNKSCSVDIKALFSPHNPFLFINSKGKT